MNIHQKARQLRLKPTGAEVVLKHLLRDCGIRRIRRQVVVGKMIVDFAIPAMNLLIEVDGGVHLHTGSKDARRDAWLRGLGFRVLRVTNDQVFDGQDFIRKALASFPATQNERTRFHGASRLGRVHEEPLRQLRDEPTYQNKPKGETERVQCHRCREWQTPRHFHARDGKNQHVCDACVAESEPKGEPFL